MMLRSSGADCLVAAARLVPGPRSASLVPRRVAGGAMSDKQVRIAKPGFVRMREELRG